jgi:hypothetical protein
LRAVLFVLLVVWGVGSTIGFLTVGDGWLKPLLVAGLVSGLTLTGIGGVVVCCIGAAGVGATARDFF